MINLRLVEQIVAAVRGAIPPDLGAQTEKNIRAALDSVFARVDLVTREEFEVQQAVLARTRALVEKLEQQVTELEKKLPRA